ncbi:MAG: SGNH/GDSL hydrolase family protein [Prevotella sp.]|jgi:lysophospholipase L1-like esterase|nr:SGNH/GDSL hydrolase family protein [Prevotella sp.]
MKKVFYLFVFGMLFTFGAQAQENNDSITLTISGKSYKQLEEHFTQERKKKDRQTDWAKFYRYEKANASITKPVKAVFLGNSITDGWAAKRPAFFADNNFTGRGISGQTTSEMLVRFRSDVIELHPQMVVILAGTNDIARNNGIISLKHIMDNIISMCELAKLNKIKPVLCSVLPATQYGWRKELRPAGEILQLNSMLKEYARKNGFTYVDYHSEMRDEQNGMPENLAKDGVHPTDEGYALMERIVLKAIGK